MSREKWRTSLVDFADKISSEVTYEESAQILRELVQKKLLLFTDMRDHPDKFFEAHRLLLSPNRRLRGPGFGIRFTVQFNLFAGSILGLGSKEQIKLLDEFQEQGRLGCFCLTEKMAGVNSGLVVNTTAEWVESESCFVINCPNEGAEKNWISQGLTASKAVVIADLILKGKHYGPHGFVVDLRDKEFGTPVKGVSMEDMGKKTTGNDLDNARIKFSNLKVPKSALLSRFAEIRNGEYFQPTKEKMRLEVIGQRLLTGRLAIAQAGLVFCKGIYNKAYEYASNRQIWSPNPKDKMFLAQLPHLSSLFEEAEGRILVLENYTQKVEKELSNVLINSSIPSTALVERIAAAKIACIDGSINLCFRLKQEVGSYGLMDGSGFEHIDFLQCCKFAEGDSRILSQKIARDTFKVFSKGKDVGGEKIKSACVELQKALVASGLVKKDFLQAWNLSYKEVYALTETVIEGHVSTLTGKDYVLRAKL
eukprot:snap_masked-scaffold_16-processed-gene-4.13-mRNA-1 protein AED:0.01 eAED:0.01 QI:0/-1/0/1/-1/1/1/0/478